MVIGGEGAVQRKEFREDGFEGGVGFHKIILPRIYSSSTVSPIISDKPILNHGDTETLRKFKTPWLCVSVVKVLSLSEEKNQCKSVSICG